MPSLGRGLATPAARERSGDVETVARLLAYHKPKGQVVSRSDERGRRTVYEGLPEWVLADGWVPVGRLDRDSRGLLLFTREGPVVDRLTGPGSPVKTYEIWVRGRVTADHAAAALAGIEDRGETLKALRVEPRGGAGPKTRLHVDLDEGRNRHLRRLFGALKDPERGTPLKVMEIKRIRIGPLALDLPSGAWRFLSDAEAAALLGGD